MDTDKRRIAPTFMLPEEFPNPEVNDIYVVLRGGIHNAVITSAQDFKYQNYGFGQPIGVNDGKIKVFRVDEASTIVDTLLSDLVEKNNGVVDWTMVLEQGQRAYRDLKEQIQGPNRVGGMEAILRFGNRGDIYLPREK
jgi:hypothetical protein